MTTSYCRHSPSLSREGNMWYPSTFLYSNKVESTIHRLRRSPFLSRKEHRFSCFPLISFRMLALCKKRTFCFIPVICKDCTVSRIQPGFLPTYEPWLIPTRIPKGFADSKQSLRPLSFLSRTGNVLHAFLCANIQELTFHQTNYCSRLQTIRWFRRSDWKPVGFLSD